MNPLHQSNLFDLCPINKLQWCFFIDSSGSTENRMFGSELSVLDIEKMLVDHFSVCLDKKPYLIEWNTYATQVETLESIKSAGGTQPASIFKNNDLTQLLQNVQVGVVITDGEIDGDSINDFAKHMTKTSFDVLLGFVVGDPKQNLPSKVNVSVLAPTLFTDSFLAFRDFEKNYIVQTIGFFQSQWDTVVISDNTTWTNIMTKTCKEITDIIIPLYNKIEKKELFDNGYIYFGGGIYFSPDKLLQYSPTWNELLALPFERICLYFKVTNKYHYLLQWFNTIKDHFVNEFITDPNEILAVENLMRRSNQIIEQKYAVSTFVNIRNKSILRNFSELSDDNINQLVENPQIRQLLYFFRDMMEIMKEDVREQDRGNSYTTQSISFSRYSQHQYCSDLSNRYSFTKKNKIITQITATFTEPYKWLNEFITLHPYHCSPQLECNICLEKSVPFILVRKQIDLENIKNRPMDFIYPPPVCAKCAQFFCNKKIDPVRAPCIAALPIVNLIDNTSTIFTKSFEQIILTKMTSFRRFFQNIFSLSTQPLFASPVKLFISAIHPVYEDNIEILQLLDNFEKYL